MAIWNRARCAPMSTSRCAGQARRWGPAARSRTSTPSASSCGRSKSRPSARSRCSKMAARSSWRPASSMRTAARRAPCGPRRRPTTTATSPIPTCCRSPSTPPGWRPSAPGCPSCPTPGRHASCRTTGSRPTTPACSWRNARSPSFSRKSRPAATASRWPTGSRARSSPRSTAPGSGSSRARFRRLPSAR